MKTSTLYRALLFTAFTLFQTLVSAGSFEVIHLRHQSAAQIIPVIKPLLDKNSLVTGADYKLVIKAPASQIAKIRKLVREIDTPLQQLVITVSQDQKTRSQLDRQSLTGQLYNKHTGIKIGQTAPGNGLNARISDDHGNLGASFNQTQTSSSSQSNQTVLTLSGQPAFIQVGQSRPLPQQQIFVKGKKIIAQQSMQYKEVQTGFYVIPRIYDQTVLLEISAKKQQFTESGPGHIKTQYVATKVEGKLGQWIALGKTDDLINNNHSGILNQRTAKSHDNRQIFVKVELARQRQ